MSEIVNKKERELKRKMNIPTLTLGADRQTDTQRERERECVNMSPQRRGSENEDIRFLSYILSQTGWIRTPACHGRQNGLI